MSAPLFLLNKRTSAIYRALLVDENGNAIPAVSTLQTLTLSLVDYMTATVINGRNAQNVLNMNGVTVYDIPQSGPNGTTYNLLWKTTTADATIVTASLAEEDHLAIFQGTWNSGLNGTTHLVVLRVSNLTTIT